MPTRSCLSLKKPLEETVIKPPRGFSPAGDVVKVELSPQPFFIRAGKGGGRRAEGRRYERRVQSYLTGMYSWRYVESPWFQFWRSSGSSSWCQPDGLLFDFDRGLITIIEVKLSHTVKAWWQLRKLYEPVLRVAFPPWTFSCVELVGSCDPHRKLPEPFTFLPDVIQAAPGAFQIKVLSKRALHGCSL